MNEACEKYGISPPIHIDKELFLQWRAPRRGTEHPHDMTNEVWKWLTETELSDDWTHTRLNAYQANQIFDGPSSMDVGPCWCFDRFGQTKTMLPDGRIVYVAGEHEDSYDPDFFIYNDVVIVNPSGDIQIFGYPVEVFPATDFHSATLVDNALILIGNLSYPQDRRYGQTQVLRLEIDSWCISQIETFGDAPGWIYKHNAELSPDGNTVRIADGEIARGDQTPLIENIDEWELNLQTWHWERLTRRQWPRFVIHRKDGKWHRLLEIKSLLFWKRLAEHSEEFEQKYKDAEKALKKQFGIFGCFGTLPDLKLFETLYKPDLATEIIEPNEDEYNIHRIRVGDVVVRYVEDLHSITITIEGELPPDVVEQLKNDVMRKFAALECTAITCQEIVSE